MGLFYPCFCAYLLFYVLLLFLQVSNNMFSYLNSQIQHEFIKYFDKESLQEIQQAQRIACNWAELAVQVNGYDNKLFDSNSFSVYPTDDFVKNVISDAEIAQIILEDISEIEDEDAKAEQVDENHNVIVDSPPIQDDKKSKENFPMMDGLLNTIGEFLKVPSHIHAKNTTN